MAVAMRGVMPVLFVMGLAGCAPVEDAAPKADEIALTGSPAHPVAGNQGPATRGTIVCTEPSPDVAQTVAAYADGRRVSASQASSVAELAGRSTALLALRDGLYQACQAYANGAIGKEAYALILSRYGQLMATLYLSHGATASTDDVTGRGGAAGAITRMNEDYLNLDAVSLNMLSSLCINEASGQRETDPWLKALCPKFGHAVGR